MHGPHAWLHARNMTIAALLSCESDANESLASNCRTYAGSCTPGIHCEDFTDPGQVNAFGASGHELSGLTEGEWHLLPGTDVLKLVSHFLAAQGFAMNRP